MLGWWYRMGMVVTVAVLPVPQLAQADVNSDAADLQKAQDQLDGDIQSLTKDPNSVTGARLEEDKAKVKAARDKLVSDIPAFSRELITNATKYGCIMRNEADSVCLVTGAMSIPFRAELTGKKDVFGGFSADVFVGLNIHTSWTQGLPPTFLFYA